jgi:hypothetical protein
MFSCALAYRTAPVSLPCPVLRDIPSFLCAVLSFLSFICSFVPVPSSSLLSVLLHLFLHVLFYPSCSYSCPCLRPSPYCTCSRPLSISCPVLPVPDYVLILLYLFLDPVSVLSYSTRSRYLSMSFLVLPAAGP